MTLVDDIPTEYNILEYNNGRITYIDQIRVYRIIIQCTTLYLIIGPNKINTTRDHTFANICLIAHLIPK